MRRILFFIALWCLVLAGPSSAAGSKATITILDEAGEPVVGVAVVVTSAAGAFRVELETDAKGTFEVELDDRDAEYLVTLEKAGFHTSELPLVPAGEKKLFLEATLPAAAAGTLTGPAGSLYEEGGEALRAGDVELARSKFQAALEVDDRLAPAYSALARIDYREGRYAEALAAAERLLELTPGASDGLEIRYLAAKAAGDEAVVAEARASLEAVGGLTATMVYDEGYVASQAGEFELAADLFREAIELDPALVPARSALSVSLFQAGDLEGAAAAIDAWLEIRPDDADGLRMRFETLRLQGDHDGARTTLVALVEAHPDTDLGELVARAKELFDDGNAEQARHDLEAIVAAGPDLAEAHHLLGLCLASLGDYPAAVRELRRFVELAPDDPEAAAASEMAAALE